MESYDKKWHFSVREFWNFLKCEHVFDQVVDQICDQGLGEGNKTVNTMYSSTGPKKTYEKTNEKIKK